MSTATTQAAASARPRAAHLPVPEGVPGIEALVAFKPSSGVRLMQLVHELLRGSSPLTPAERELIAGHVSARNDCAFCAHVHSTAAGRLLDGDVPAACRIAEAGDGPEISARLRALLRLAGKVQRSGHEVTADDVAAARLAGATDEEIHDTVLIAAAFCMVNRYVDGLAAPTPEDPAVYAHIAEVVTSRGYAPG